MERGIIILLTNSSWSCVLLFLIYVFRTKCYWYITLIFYTVWEANFHQRHILTRSPHGMGQISGPMGFSDFFPNEKKVFSVETRFKNTFCQEWVIQIILIWFLVTFFNKNKVFPGFLILFFMNYGNYCIGLTHENWNYCCGVLSAWN